jgi:hypothetical protein
MLREASSLILVRDPPEYGLKRGDVGTIVVMVHRAGGYEAEFMTLAGGTVAVTSLSASEVRPIARREIAHTRSIEAGHVSSGRLVR